MLLSHSCHQWVHLPKTEKLYRFGSSLSASKMKLYLKEHGLPVSGGKAALVARVLGAGEAQGKENPDEQQSSSFEDQEDNEQSDDSEIDDYEEQSFEVLFIPDDAVECVAVR